MKMPRRGLPRLATDTMERPINPLIVLLDGQQLELLLTWAGVKRLMRHFEVKTLKDLLDLVQVDLCNAIPILYEAIRNKPEELSEEKFEEMLPANLDGTAKLAIALFGASWPEPKNPTPEGSQIVQ